MRGGRSRPPGRRPWKRACRPGRVEVFAHEPGAIPPEGGVIAAGDAFETDFRVLAGLQAVLDKLVDQSKLGGCIRERGAGEGALDLDADRQVPFLACVVGEGLQRMGESFAVLLQRAPVYEGSGEVREVGADLVLEAAECPDSAERPVGLGADVVFKEAGKGHGHRDFPGRQVRDIVPAAANRFSIESQPEQPASLGRVGQLHVE